MKARITIIVATCLLMVAGSVFGGTAIGEDGQEPLKRGAVSIDTFIYMAVVSAGIQVEVDRRVAANCFGGTESSSSQQPLMVQLCVLKTRVDVLEYYMQPLLAERMVAQQKAREKK